MSNNVTIFYKEELSAFGLNGVEEFGHGTYSCATTPVTNHIHHNCIEISIVFKGNESYFIEDQTFEMTGGEAFVAFENQPHRNANATRGVCEAYWIVINPHVKTNFLGLSDQMAAQLKSKLISLNQHLLKADKESMLLLQKTFSTLILPNPNLHLLHGSLISFLSVLLFSESHSLKDDELTKLIIAHIDTNILDDISSAEICEKFNISLSSFKHKFKELTGMTPRDYINSKKIKKAKEMLAFSKNITEVAMDLSFNTSDYFSVVFKKYTGMSPSKYLSTMHESE